MGNQKSIPLPISLGYEEVPDVKAFKGFYYIKDSKIWIHNIDGLIRELKAQSKISNGNELEQLDELGYDVKAYYEYN